MQQPKPKPKPALKKTTKNFGAYKVPVGGKQGTSSGHAASVASSDKSEGSPPALARPRRSSGRSSQQDGQGSDRSSTPESRRTFRSTSSKGSRRLRRSGQGYQSDSNGSSAGPSRPVSAGLAVASPAAPKKVDDTRESTAESILGLWDVNRAQEKSAIKEEVREKRYRASQEGYTEVVPEAPSVDALLRQRLSLSKWKGAVKAVGAVNKMGMLVRMRSPSAPTLLKLRQPDEPVAGIHLPKHVPNHCFL